MFIDSDVRNHISVFFFKQKRAYELRISYLSSDVCSSDLYDGVSLHPHHRVVTRHGRGSRTLRQFLQLPCLESVHSPAFATTARSSATSQPSSEIGRASWRERVC